MLRPQWSLTLLLLILSLTASIAQDAASLFRDKDYDAAYTLYKSRLESTSKHQDKLHYGAGTAAYKKGDHYAAAEHLGQAILSDDIDLQAKAYYNLGNTFYQLGKAMEDSEELVTQWQNAIAHYQEAESRGTDVATNAKHNRELIEKKLEALKQQEQQEKSQDEQQQQD